MLVMLEKCKVGSAGGAQCKGEGVHDDVYDGAIRTRVDEGIWWQERMMSGAKSSRVQATATQAGSEPERSAQDDSRSSERVGAAPTRGRGIHSSRRAKSGDGERPSRLDLAGGRRSVDKLLQSRLDARAVRAVRAGVRDGETSEDHHHRGGAPGRTRGRRTVGSPSREGDARLG